MNITRVFLPYIISLSSRRPFGLYCSCRPMVETPISFLSRSLLNSLHCCLQLKIHESPPGSIITFFSHVKETSIHLIKFIVMIFLAQNFVSQMLDYLSLTPLQFELIHHFLFSKDLQTGEIFAFVLLRILCSKSGR